MPWSRAQVQRLRLDDATQALFASLHPALLREVPRARRHVHYNMGPDALWVASDGTGMLIADENFGPMAYDGIDTHVHLLLPGEVHVTFYLGRDYGQDALHVIASGPTAAPVEAALSGTVAVLSGW